MQALDVVAKWNKRISQNNLLKPWLSVILSNIINELCRWTFQGASRMALH